MTPLRLMILQFSQSFFTDARTFIKIYCSFHRMRPLDKSHGDISTVTRSPSLKPTWLGRILEERCAKKRCPFVNSTRHNVLGSTSTTRPSTLMPLSRNTSKSPAQIPSPEPYAQNGQTVDHLG